MNSPCIKSLLPSSKIISIYNDYADFKPENLHKILCSVENFGLDGATPVALVGVIGPPSSGKSFLTNLIIQYLRRGLKGDGHGTWLSTLSAKNGEMLESGFSWGGVSNPRYFKPEEGFSGIYLWPEPFLMEVGSDKKILVWILHAHCNSEGDEDLLELEKYMTMVCSRILEIKWKNEDEIRILERYSSIQQHAPFCHSAVIAFRLSGSKPNLGNWKEFLLKRLPNPEKRQEYQLTLESFHHVHVTHIPSKPGSLEDIRGHLKLKGLTRDLKSTIQLLLNKVELLKIVEESGVTLENLHHTLEQGAIKVNFGKTVDNGTRSPGEKDQIGLVEGFQNLSVSENLDECISAGTVNDAPVEQTPENEDTSGVLENSVRSSEIFETSLNVPESWEDYVDTVADPPMSDDLELVEVADEDSEEQIMDMCSGSKDTGTPDAMEAHRLAQQQEQEMEEQKKIEDFVNSATADIEKALLAKLQHWFDNDLHWSNVRKIPEIFEQVREDVLQTYCSTVIPQEEMWIWSTFVSQVEAQCSNILPFTESMERRLSKFIDSLYPMFQQFGFFVPDQLLQLMQETCLQIVQDLDQQSIELQLVRRGIERLQLCFAEDNKAITEREQDLQESVKNHVIDLYEVKMKQCHEISGPYSPQTLWRIHSKLMNSLKETFESALAFTNSGSSAYVSEEWLKMEENLNSQFRQILQLNNSVLEDMQRALSKVLSKFEKQYIEKIETILQENPDGLTDIKLKSQNETIKRELMALMQKEIQVKVRHNEPLVSHQTVLKRRLERYFQNTVLPENSKKLQEKLQSATALVSGPSPSKALIAEDPEKAVQQLPPLVFHLKSTGIEMAMQMNGAFERLFDQLHVNQKLPACVAVTKSNYMVYGSQVATAAPSSLKFTWKIADFFFPKHMNASNNWAYYDEESKQEHRLSQEFMLAVLLKKLKISAEAQKKGVSTTALVAVPIWLSSFQRVQVKDAARIAGFVNVHLVNEAAAAAYNFMEGSDEGGQVLILAENSDMIDMFVFGYQKPPPEVKMLSHQNYYKYNENGEKERGNMLQLVKWAVKLMKKGKKKEIPDQLLQIRQKAIRLAKEKQSTWDLKEFMVICDTEEKWIPILKELGCENGKKLNTGINGNLAVLQGATSLASTNNGKDIGDIICDKLGIAVYAHEIETKKGWQEFPKGFPLQTGSKPRIVPIPSAKRTSGDMKLIIYQDIFDEMHFITEVTMRNGDDCRAMLSISNEAIVTLKEVRNEKSWKYFNLNEEDIDLFKNLLQRLSKSPKAQEKAVVAEVKE